MTCAERLKALEMTQVGEEKAERKLNHFLQDKEGLPGGGWRPAVLLCLCMQSKGKWA